LAFPPCCKGYAPLFTQNRLRYLKDRLEGGGQPPYDMMVQWTRTMKTYTEVNRQFFKELGKFFGQ
jgi:hypothetical protein